MQPANRSIALQPGDVRRLLLLQVVLTAVAAVAFGLARGPEAGLAAAYGGGIALLTAWLLGRRVRRATELAKAAPGQETATLYIGAVQRFLAVLVLFGVGMGVLGLEPVALLVGFGVAQVGYILSGAQVRAHGSAHVEKLG